MRITILQRPGPLTAKDFSSDLAAFLSSLEGELSASAEPAGFSKNGWTQVDVEGEDYEILTELITKELALAQTDISKIEMHGCYHAMVSGEHSGGLVVDIGIETPKPSKVIISLNALRAQLADGRPLSGREIIDNYCLIPGSTVAIRVTRLDPSSGAVEGWLSDSQIELFSDWIKLGLDRIHVFDCSRERLNYAIRKANLERDIISTESLTITAHSVQCKLGTDAVGLIPKLGSILRKNQLKPFIPRRIVAKCRRW